MGAILSAAEAREWTNLEGQKIEAEYQSSDETHVVLMFRGKEIRYELAKLSEADREYARKQLEAKRASIRTGWINDFPVTGPSGDEAKNLLLSPTAKKIYRAYDTGNFPENWKVNKSDAKAEFAYENGNAFVYVPASYDGVKLMGVYLHISASDNGERAQNYIPVMDRMNLIYISPKGTSNRQPNLRRVRLAVDSFLAVKKEWAIDPSRCYVGGISGGGHMAMLTHLMFPEHFVASVSHAAQSYLPTQRTSGHFPGAELKDFKSKAFKDHKWCVISGNKDYNYKEILDTTERWKEAKLPYRFFDIPGMGHTNASPEALENALKWIEEP